MPKPPRRPARQLRKAGGDDALKSGAVVARKDPSQPGLFDPPNSMPELVPPCLPTLVSKPPPGEGWSHELKWDGYRIVGHVDFGQVRLMTRNAKDWTTSFPSIAKALASLPVDSAIVDGEAVVLDEGGISHFNMLQKALGGRHGRRPASEAVLFAFDLLYLDGHDLRERPLAERREALAGILQRLPSDGALRFSEDFDATGDVLFRHTCQCSLEGIVSKRLDSPYRGGRQTTWLKTKCVQSDDFVIIGYERSEAARGSLGALLLAADEGGRLVDRGKVGTGFTAGVAHDLRKQLDAIVTDRPAIPGMRRKSAVWTRPRLIAEVEYRGITEDGSLRHPSFKGLREDK